MQEKIRNTKDNMFTQEQLDKIEKYLKDRYFDITQNTRNKGDYLSFTGYEYSDLTGRYLLKFYLVDNIIQCWGEAKDGFGDIIY